MLTPMPTISQDQLVPGWGVTRDGVLVALFIERAEAIAYVCRYNGEIEPFMLYGESAQ